MERKSGRLAVWSNAKVETAGMPLSSGSVWDEEQEAGSWGTTESGRQSALEEHRLATVGTQDFGEGWCRVGVCAGLGRGAWGSERAEVLAHGCQVRPPGSCEEAIVTDLHKAFR